MNILLIGSGGREHALAYTLSKSLCLEQLYCAPGNPGIFSLARPANINISNHNEVIDFCRNKAIDLVVVGPEQPLAEGIADVLNNAGICVFGPSQKAARLESSKGFAKDFMKRHNIPTANYVRFGVELATAAHEYIDLQPLPHVIKADGLAAGKGVIIAETYEEGHEALESMFCGVFKDAGKEVVIEEYLYGEEASVLAITDGKDFITLAPSQDHKRAFDGGKGKNTGGMGAYAPAPLVNEEVIRKVEDKIIRPTIDGMAAEGNPFIGCLYAGLMIFQGEPKVVEFNVRFGDPETQAVLPLFEGEFARLLYSTANGKLEKETVKNISNGSACCVVLASNGYPDSYQKGFEIKGIEQAESDGAIVFHAGTALKDNKLITTGGRVLGVTGLGNSLKAAIDNAYSAVNKISFENNFYRKDIGEKGLK